MPIPKKPYLLQTENWSKFWTEGNEDGHQVFCKQKDFENYSIKAYIYKYPYFLGQSFGYLPKGPVLSFKNYESGIKITKLISDLKTFFVDVEDLCRKEGLCFLKIDFDDNLTNTLSLKTNLELLDFFKKEKIFKTSSPIYSQKSLQYLETPVLDLSSLNSKILGDFETKNLSNFFEENSDFWSTVNQNVRRYTRKSLKQNWKISTEKTKENFEKFWQTFESTTERQGFNSHPKKYLQTFFEADFSRIIILSNDEDEPEAVWLGAVDEDSKTIFYLYGGNTSDSLKKHGQYLVHLVVVALAFGEGLQFYDLGGYSEKEGYGKFKLNYKGEMRRWLGPVDLVFKSFEFSVIKFLIFSLKLIRIKK